MLRGRVFAEAREDLIVTLDHASSVFSSSMSLCQLGLSQSVMTKNLLHESVVCESAIRVDKSP